jgi:hypothetical protein
VGADAVRGGAAAPDGKKCVARASLLTRTRRNLQSNKSFLPFTIHTLHIHIYHARCIPKGVAEASQIFLQDVHVLPKLLRYEVFSRLQYSADVSADKPIVFSRLL